MRSIGLPGLLTIEKEEREKGYCKMVLEKYFVVFVCVLSAPVNPRGLCH